MKNYAEALALALLSVGGWGPHDGVDLTKKAFLPNKGKVQSLGLAEFLPDATMFETPIGFRKAAHLNEPVKLTLAGKDFTFAAGDQFAGANIYGKSASLIPRSAAIFCGNERKIGRASCRERVCSYG